MHVPLANRMAIWMALLLLAMGLENYTSPFVSSSFIAREYRKRLIKEFLNSHRTNRYDFRNVRI